MCDGLDLGIPRDSDLLFREIENWMCCVISFNKELVLATDNNQQSSFIITILDLLYSVFSYSFHCSFDLMYVSCNSISI